MTALESYEKMMAKYEDSPLIQDVITEAFLAGLNRAAEVIADEDNEYWRDLPLPGKLTGIIE